MPTKVDRAAMGVSLETRVPFLDHRVIEFAWRLPQFMKLHRGKLNGYYVKFYIDMYLEIADRPKMGFGIPIDSWLRGPLRQWADDLLHETRLKHEGFFHPKLVRKNCQSI